MLLGGLALQAADPPFLEDLRLRVFDAYQRLKPRPYRPAPVRIIDLDDESLERLGQWPWPRTQLAEMVRRLHRAGAAAIVFDIVFAEPDRTSPQRAAEAWPESPALEAVRPALKRLPDHDRLFAEALREAPVVTGFSLTAGPSGRPPQVKAGFGHTGPDPRPFLVGFPAAVVNLPEIEAAARGNGHFNMLAERDGILRRLPLLLKIDSTLLPSLWAEALRLQRGAGSYVIRSSRVGIEEIRVADRAVPTDAQGRVWLYDTGFVPERFIPAWRMLRGDFDRAEVEGKIVFIGTSAAGLKDFRATPSNPVAAGVEIHAQMVEQMIHGQFLRRPAWAPGAEMLFLLALGLAGVLLLPRVGPLVCAAGSAAAVGAVFAGSWALFARRGFLLDPFFPSLVVLGIYLAASLGHFLKTEAERRWVRQAFGRYMSPVLVRRLAEHPEQLRLGGETRTMTFLFADIREFTALSERFDAQGLTQFINRFLTPMTEIILSRSGTIDKYMGDCIMAFWNAPVEDPQHARHACEAALRMQAAARAMGSVRIGVGINTGPCCVGNMGSEQRFDYSVLGDEVNLASRLEGLSKVYGVDILIGPATQEQAADCATLELDLVTVKGKTKPVRVHALLGGPDLASRPEFRKLQGLQLALLAAYRAQEWEKARALIAECLVLEPAGTDLRGVYRLYQERVRAYSAAPPGPRWDGVFIAPAK